MEHFSEFDLRGELLDGRYEVRDLLGIGGMGSVYSAWQSDLNRLVAIKLLHAHLFQDPQSLRRFVNEAKVLAHLDHPNLMRIYGIGYYLQKIPYLVMEYLEGKTLSTKIIDEGPYKWQDLIDMGISICSALGYAHAEGVLHRDLKPQNIMVVNINGDQVLKVLDFGLAKGFAVDTTTGTATGWIVGSPPYMSPESCAGQKVDERSDIYSLGCTLYECLCGRPPFISDHPIGLLSLHQSSAPARPSALARDKTVPANMDALILKALEKEPVHRYQTMSEFGQAFESLRNGGDLPFSLQDLRISKLEEEPKLNAKSGRLIVIFCLVALIFALSFLSYTLYTRTNADVSKDWDNRIKEIMALPKGSSKKTAAAKAFFLSVIRYMENRPDGDRFDIAGVDKLDHVLNCFDEKSFNEVLPSLDLAIGRMERSKSYSKLANAYYLRAKIMEGLHFPFAVTKSLGQAIASYVLAGEPEIAQSLVQGARCYLAREKIIDKAAIFWVDLAELELLDQERPRLKEAAGRLKAQIFSGELGAYSNEMALNLSRFYRKLGDKVSTLGLLEWAANFKGGRMDETGAVWLELARVYKEYGNYAAADKYYERCLDNAHDFGYLDQLRDISAERDQVLQAASKDR